MAWAGYIISVNIGGKWQLTAMASSKEKPISSGGESGQAGRKWRAAHMGLSSKKPNRPGA